MKMFIFSRLLLAHLLADFPLQTKKVFELKIKGNYGLILHSFIFAATSAILCFPYFISNKMWLVILFCFLTHYIIDKLKIVFFFKYKADNLFIFLLDQFFHILVILSISHLDLFNLSSIEITPNMIPKKLFYQAYYSNKFIYCLCFFAITTYGGNILLPYLKKTFFEVVDNNIPQSYIYYNMGERAIITLLTILHSSYFLLLIPLLFLGRIFLKGKDNKRDFLINVLIALSLGIALKIILI